MKFKQRIDFATYLSTIKNPVAAEIGSHVGNYAADLMTTCNNLTLYCIDLWMPSEIPFSSDYGDFLNRMQPFINVKRLIPIREYSVDAARFFRDGFFDFVYIDADHSYESVKADIAAWRPKVKPGGLLAGHDYKNSHGKFVKKAVDEIFGESNIQSTAERCGSWWIKL